MRERRNFYYWRVIATGISFAFFGIGALVLGWVILPLTSFFSESRRSGQRHCRRIIQLSFCAFVWLMRSLRVLTWEVEGASKLGRGGQLVIANHPTLIDIVFLISMIPNATCIVKAGLYRNVFTRGPVGCAGYVPNNSTDQMMADCAEELAGGASVVVFPEGSRSEANNTLRFKRGAANLWLRTRCDIALVTIVSNPPTLGKYEKWYQIPSVRPHFKLAITSGEENAPANGEGRASIEARALTRNWQDHFEKEIAV
jgi:1-acyl-sn-glycerol-3-phosphate acyltransferase